nr:hypothetical protein Itr_chr08CG15100 [Ipomoea trifida]
MITLSYSQIGLENLDRFSQQLIRPFLVVLVSGQSLDCVRQEDSAEVVSQIPRGLPERPRDQLFQIPKTREVLDKVAGISIHPAVLEQISMKLTCKQHSNNERENAEIFTERH